MNITITVFEDELKKGIVEGDRRQAPADASLTDWLDTTLKQAPAWSPILWKDNMRKSEKFECAHLAVVDWDSPSKEQFGLVRGRLSDVDILSEFVRTLMPKSATAPDYVHLTQGGLRLIWVLDKPVDDPEKYRRLLVRLALDCGGDLQSTHLAVGFAAARHLAGGRLEEVMPCST